MPFEDELREIFDGHKSQREVGHASRHLSRLEIAFVPVCHEFVHISAGKRVKYLQRGNIMENDLKGDALTAFHWFR